MENLELTFASKESSLTVRSFRVEQRMNEPFDIQIVALSKQEDVDLDALVGQGASFRIGGGDGGGPSRVWTGVVAQAEQTEVEPDGTSTYALRIVPQLWRATRRRNSRIFQHLTLPEIATAVLKDWDIVPELLLDASQFARFEYRVQYGETDYQLITRVLEESGVSFYFKDPDLVKEPNGQTSLVFSAEPDVAELRAGDPIPFVNIKDSTPRGEFISHVRLVHESRSGKFTVRDFDFRSRPDLALFADAKTSHELEGRLESYHYLPGAFVVEPEGGGAAKLDEKEAQAFATRQLLAQRQGRRAVEFETSCFDLRPGSVFTMVDHPRRELDQTRILVTAQVIEGDKQGDFYCRCRGVFATEPYRPMMRTPKPRIFGVQSALVVGPSGQEIHTDEYGRVRVQFHWDREGQRDQNSSCFIRVSQAWAGRGYGVHAVPRVGDEVLVEFFDGDPDQPVITGRVHNSSSRVPLTLPATKTRTTWRTESTPGGGGWNEITLEDQKGEELFFLQAEKDMSRLVKNAETATIGTTLTTTIGQSETHQVKTDQSVTVGGDRTIHIAGSDTLNIAKELNLKLGDSGTGLAINSDKRIVLTTGEASIVLDGPNIYFDGHAAIRMAAGQLVSMSGSEVHVDGTPNVFLNSLGAQVAQAVPLTGIKTTLASIQPTVEAAEQKLTSLLNTPVDLPGLAPEALAVPAHIETQLQAARDKITNGVTEVESKIKDQVEVLEDNLKGKLGELKQNLVPKVEAARAEVNAYVDKMRGAVEKVKSEAAAFVGDLKSRATALKAEVEGRIQQAKDLAENVKTQIRATIDKIQEKIADVTAQARTIVANIKQRITDVKNQIKSAFDDLRTKATAVVQNLVNQVKATIDSVKTQLNNVVTSIKTSIDDAKAQVKSIVDGVKNEIQTIKDQVHQAIDGVKNAITDVKNQVKGMVNEVKTEAKQAWNDLKSEGKAIVKDAKAEWNDVKTQAKDIAKDAKQEWNDVKGEAKQAWSDAKAEGKEIASEAKQAAADAKQTAQQAVADAKQTAQQAAADAKQTAQQAVSDAKQTAQQAATDLKQTAQQTASDVKQSAGGLTNFSHTGTMPTGTDIPRPPTSTVLSRAGGFGGDSAARMINSTPGATYLQSPTDGQLMIVRTAAAQQLSGSQLSQAVVDHQMGGMTAVDALGSALRQNGYVLYERPWESVSGLFVQNAAL